MLDGVKEHGRFVYIEPNDMKLSIPSNGIQFPYEDYCISVNLTVERYERTSCGQFGDKTKIIEYNSHKGTISFLGGSGGDNNKQGFLTTNFTDISSNNDTENRECLGIESINISYDSYYFPNVEIKFIDLRGASLFMPQEKALKRTMDSGNEDITQLDGGSFFKSLFTFPYPVFKLTVKGFLGKSITYKLSVSKFISNFNCDTGNFEATVNFIGYMYGVYTDIPMTYLAIAPYTKAGKLYWESKKASDQSFRYIKSDGGVSSVPILTFPELKLMITSAETALKTIRSGVESGSEVALANEKIGRLQSLLDVFPFKNWNKIESKDNITYYTYGGFGNKGESVPNISGITDFLTLLNSYEVSTNTKDLSSSVYKINEYYKEYNIDNKKQKYWIPQYKFIVDSDTNEFRGYTIKYEDDKDGKSVYKESNLANANEVCNKYPGLSACCYNDQNRGKYVYLTCIDSSFENIIKNKISDLQENIDKLKKSIETEAIGKMEQAIGFNFTIENIFRTLYAHLETFMHCYYSRLDTIKSEINSNKRNITELFGGKELTDINGDNNQVPPFPMTYSVKNNEKSVVYPTDVLKTGYVMPEDELVKDLLDATQLYAETDKRIAEEIQRILTQAGNNSTTTQLNSNVNNFIPLTPYDFINNGYNLNPYSVIDSIKNNGTEAGGNIITIFFLRAYYLLRYCTASRDDELIEYIAGVEGNNFKNAVPNISKTLCDNFIKLYENYQGAIAAFDYTTNKKDKRAWDIVNSKQLFHKLNSGYNVHTNWLPYKDKYLLPVGEYNVLSIQSDINTESLNDKYLVMDNDNQTKIDGYNYNTFFIDDNELFFDDLKNNIKSNGELKYVNENADFVFDKIMSFSGGIDFYIPYVIDNVCIENRYYPAIGNIFYEQNTNNNFHISKAFEKDSSNLSLGSSCVNQLPCFDSIVGAVTTVKHDSLFTQRYFIEEESNEWKAYMFLFGIPISWKYQKKVYESNNCIVLKSALLREGAYYWGLTQEGFGLVNYSYRNSGITKMVYTSQGEIPLTDNTTIHIVDSDNTLTYKTWSNLIGSNGNMVTTSRKKKLCEYFQEWANSVEFKSILESLSVTYGSDTLNDEAINQMEKLHREKVEVKETQTKLVNFYLDKVTIIDYNRNTWRTVSYTTLQCCFHKFIKVLKDLYDTQIKDFDSNNVIVNGNVTVEDSNFNRDYDLKTAIYINLKTLYDKWLCCMPRETWTISEGEYKNFLYIDSFYNKIGNRFIVNGSQVKEILNSILPTIENMKDNKDAKYNGMSVYEFMAEVAQKNCMSFLALPQKFGLSNVSPSEIYEMFKPIPFLKASRSNSIEGTYVCMYAYEPSNHLVIPDGEYDDDSFIIDLNGENAPTLPISIFDLSGEKIPSFGVSYAKQSQSIFKRISFNAQDQQATDVAMATTLEIASKDGSEPGGTVLFGQDIYRIYANMSFYCTVEMIGDIQVTPLMYFQLNNIPMWKGSYLIIKVEHSIKANSMTTTFTGVRQSKYAIPLTTNGFMCVNNDGNVDVYSSTLTEGQYVPQQEEKITFVPLEYGNEKPGIETWKNCVYQMGLWYNTNINTYQQRFCTNSSPIGRSYRQCSLFNEAKIGSKIEVGDDCSSFVTACLNYYLYSIGQKYDMITSRDGIFRSTDFTSNGNAASLLRRLGFEYIPITPSTGTTKQHIRNNSLKGDIISKGGSHVEIYWGQGNPLIANNTSMMSEGWGNCHSSQCSGSNPYPHMPTWYADIEYQDLWRMKN